MNVLSVSKVYFKSILSVLDRVSLDDWSFFVSFYDALLADEKVQIRLPLVLSNEDKFLFLKSFSAEAYNFPDECYNFLKILVVRKRLYILSELRKSLLEYQLNLNHKVSIQVFTPKLMNETQIGLLKRLLVHSDSNKSLDFSFFVEPELVGGLKFVVGDVVFDASTENQLKRLSNNLML